MNEFSSSTDIPSKQIERPLSAMSGTAQTGFSSPTRDTSLPLPPRGSQLFAHLNAGDTPHDKWIPISVHTAKCDLCLVHNTSVIQRCTRCNRQLCRECLKTASNDGVHIVKEDELEWKPRPRITLRQKVTRAAANNNAVPATPPNTASNRVVKTRATRMTARRTLATQRPLSRYVNQDATDEDELFVSDMGRSYQKDSHSDDGDDGYSTGDWTPSMEQGKLSGPSRKKAGKGTRRTPSEMGQFNSRKGKDNEGSFGFNQPTGFGMAFDKMTITGTGDNFADAIAEVAQQKAQREREAKEREFQQDKRKAWENNPILVDLRNQGRHEEAESIFNATCELVRMRRQLQ